MAFVTTSATIAAGDDPMARRRRAACGSVTGVVSVRVWLTAADDTAPIVPTLTPMPPRPLLLERYRDLVARENESFPVTLGEGGTPLIHARRLGAVLGLDHL